MLGRLDAALEGGVELLCWLFRSKAQGPDEGRPPELARFPYRAVDGRAATREYQACRRSHFGSSG